MAMSRRTFTFALGAAAGAATLGIHAAGGADARVVKIVARRFTFSPDRIPLAKGVPVVLEIRTLDVLMGFSVPDFQTRADVIPGKVARVRLVPDRAGTFTFLCDIFCGSGHESMNGTIVVT